MAGLWLASLIEQNKLWFLLLWSWFNCYVTLFKVKYALSALYCIVWTHGADQTMRHCFVDRCIWFLCVESRSFIKLLGSMGCAKKAAILPRDLLKNQLTETLVYFISAFCVKTNILISKVMMCTEVISINCCVSHAWCKDGLQCQQGFREI